MTREEAIRYLSEEQEKTKEVVALTERDFKVSESVWHTEYEAFALAIAALREQDDHFREATKKVGHKWISVEERLPEATGKYIVCTEKKSVYCAKFYKYISERHPEGYFGTDSYTHITHWMPMPEPPEVEV